MARSVTYRRVRVDFWTHPKTRPLGLVEKAIVLWLCSSGHAACIQRVSVTQLCRAIDPSTPDTLFRGALERLHQLGIVRWDERAELLWLVEGLDEQGFRGEKNDVSTRKHLEPFELCPITEAFRERYPGVVPESWNTVSDTVSRPSDHVERAQNPSSPAPAPAPAPAPNGASPTKRRTTRPPSLDAHTAAQYLYDAIRSHTPGFMADGKPTAIETKLKRWARDIDVGMRNDGMTLSGCREAVDAAHRGRDDFWHSNLLSGKKLRQHYEKLRIRSNGRTTDYDPDEIDYGAVAEEMRSWTTPKPPT